MFSFFVLAGSLNLNEMRWLILHSENNNLYIAYDQDNGIKVLQANYPTNYADERIVQFKPIDSAHLTRDMEGTKAGGLIDSVHQIILGNEKICATEGKYYSEIIKCRGMANDLDSWRVKSVDGGFNLYNQDKCITLVQTQNDSLENRFDVQLLPCAKSPNTVWKIEMMERNFIYPKDLKEKYVLLRKLNIAKYDPFGWEKSKE